MVLLESAFALISLLCILSRIHIRIVGVDNGRGATSDPLRNVAISMAVDLSRKFPAVDIWAEEMYAVFNRE